MGESLSKHPEEVSRHTVVSMDHDIHKGEGVSGQSDQIHSLRAGDGV